ncbi:MAG: response regulator [Terracidiphilus sp.]|jgi:FixJ family two-component response regulator/GGDEF domain-containing protein
MADRVLFVDDEKDVLDGYQRMLYKDFAVSTALGGQQGLASIQEHGPYAVVISDMRMPGMNGAEFLAQVRQKAPGTVRMLLTGCSDMRVAIDAVNEGNIFRFLTKPCEKEALVSAIKIGLVQYHSAAAEMELVKKAQTIERSQSDWDSFEICQWDNGQGPTGLPGPTQARARLAPLLGVDLQGYVALLKLPVLPTIEQRYGEEAAGSYLKSVTQFLKQALRSDDQLFHWGRDVLMAVVRRQLSPAAVRMEIARRTSASHEHLLEVNGRSVVIATSIAFDLLPVSQFSTLDDMLVAFDSSLSGRTGG